MGTFWQKTRGSVALPRDHWVDVKRGLGIDEVMTRSPAAVEPQVLAAEAVRIMEERRISQLLVVDADLGL